MIARIHKSMQEKDKGFTLIELLVVMIIIGILAAIAIPVFLNQRKKANDTAAKSDVSTVAKEIAAYYVDSTTAAPAVSLAANRYSMATTPASDLGPASANVSGVKQGFTAAAGSTPLAWCVEIDYNSGTKTSVAYGSDTGLHALGSTCAADGSITG